MSHDGFLCVPLQTFARIMVLLPTSRALLVTVAVSPGHVNMSFEVFSVMFTDNVSTKGFRRKRFIVVSGGTDPTYLRTAKNTVVRTIGWNSAVGAATWRRRPDDWEGC